MLLTTVESVRAPLGFEDMTDINAAITQAIHAADPQLSAEINTTFAAGTITDTFYVEQPTYVRHGYVDPLTGQRTGHMSTEFRLSNGFLTAAPTVLVFDQFGGTSTMDLSATIFTNLEKGVMRDIGTALWGKYVTVAYSYGFPADGTDPTSYDLTVVPLWLQTAAQVRATRMLSGNPSIKEAAIVIDTAVLDQQYSALVAQKLRYAPAALLPL
jgi:hypothetical protein